MKTTFDSIGRTCFGVMATLALGLIPSNGAEPEKPKGRGIEHDWDRANLARPIPLTPDWDRANLARLVPYETDWLNMPSATPPSIFDKDVKKDPFSQVNPPEYPRITDASGIVSYRFGKNNRSFAKMKPAEKLKWYKWATIEALEWNATEYLRVGDKVNYASTMAMLTPLKQEQAASAQSAREEEILAELKEINRRLKYGR